jgi:hypothetical protein
MRQHHTYSITQSDAYIPSMDMFQRTQTPMTAGRASKFAFFVLGFACGTGVAILLVLLGTWFSPPTPATATSVMSDDQAQVWTLSPREIEELVCFRC